MTQRAKDVQFFEHLWQSSIFERPGRWQELSSILRTYKYWEPP